MTESIPQFSFFFLNSLVCRFLSSPRLVFHQHGVDVWAAKCTSRLHWDVVLARSFASSQLLRTRKQYQAEVVSELLKGDLLFLGHYQKRMDGF